MNILFVCKYNRFRSRVAEAYFKKINKNKSIKTDGAGIFGGWYPLDPIQIKVAKKYKIDINGKPQSLTYQKLKWADLIIVTANDVPKRIFKKTFVGKRKVIKWWIPDVKGNKTKEHKTEKIIKSIMRKIDQFNNKLA
jgi:protein-tyrosine-phosphatase